MSSGDGEIEQLEVVLEPLLVLLLWAWPDHLWSHTGVDEQSRCGSKPPMSPGNATLSSSPCHYIGR